MYIQTAHLFIEKYSMTEQELFLDFVQEKEFIYFSNRGDVYNDRSLMEGRFRPTMLLIHGCAPKQKMHEGAMLRVNMNRLIDIAFRVDNNAPYSTRQYDNTPAMVFLEIQDGRAFADLIDDMDSSVSDYINTGFIERLESTWHGSPCALNNLGDEMTLRVWNVGQGNTNSISDEDNLTLFDFGASVYYSKQQLRRIIEDHAHLLKGKECITLLISHWDVDHYNCLCAVDDEFLKRICCVFFPSEIVTLTAKQITARLIHYCKYRVVISPARGTSKKCGVQIVFQDSRYTLFTGEKSKNINKSGLLLVLHNKRSIALLTADHSNYQIWDCMYNKIIFKNLIMHVVVPHHGGKCGNTPIRSGFPSGIAAISTGSNSYGHPQPKIIVAYRNAHYKVVRTDHCEQDVIIRM